MVYISFLPAHRPCSQWEDDCLLPPASFTATRIRASAPCLGHVSQTHPNPVYATISLLPLHAAADVVVVVILPAGTKAFRNVGLDLLWRPCV